MTGRGAAPKEPTKIGLGRGHAEGAAADDESRMGKLFSLHYVRIWNKYFIFINSIAVVDPNNRGAVRGRRVLHEIVRCKPTTCVSKHGKTGRQLVLATNYFKIVKRPDWSLIQYHVDFQPPIDVTRIRRALVYQHRELFDGYIYNGSTLFTCTNLKNKMVNECLEVPSQLRDGDPVVLKFRFVGTVSADEPEMMQIMNMILRNSMEKLHLQEMSRNFYDPQAKVHMYIYEMHFKI